MRTIKGIRRNLQDHLLRCSHQKEVPQNQAQLLSHGEIQSSLLSSH